MSKFSACGGLFPLYSEVFSPPQAENFDILGPQNDDFRRGNRPPQAENFGILGPQSDDFRREIARRRRKFWGFGKPENLLPDPPQMRVIQISVTQTFV